MDMLKRIEETDRWKACEKWTWIERNKLTRNGREYTVIIQVRWNVQ